MKTNVKSYRGYRFPPQIISHGVWDPKWDPKLPETDRISAIPKRTSDPLTPEFAAT